MLRAAAVALLGAAAADAGSVRSGSRDFVTQQQWTERRHLQWGAEVVGVIVRPTAENFGEWCAGAGAPGAERLLREEGFQSASAMLEVGLTDADLAELGLPAAQRAALLRALSDMEPARGDLSAASAGAGSLSAWLEAAGAGDAEAALREEGFASVEELLEVGLTEGDLEELGLPMKLRRQLLRALDAEQDRGCESGQAQAAAEPPLVAAPAVRARQLVRREGVAVGHRQRWPLEDGRTVSVETLSMQPLVFRLLDYLLEHEADEIVNTATSARLSSGSSTFTTGSFGDKHPKTYKDADNDGLLSDRELLFACDQIADAHFQLSDIHEMISSLGMDLNGDRSLDRAELAAGPDGATVEMYLSQLLKRSPQKRSRLSDLAWIGPKHTPLAATLRKRLETVMALPASVASLSDRMQVVRYTSGGQYTAHLDSGAAPQPRTKKVGAMPCW